MHDVRIKSGTRVKAIHAICFVASLRLHILAGVLDPALDFPCQLQSKMHVALALWGISGIKSKQAKSHKSNKSNQVHPNETNKVVLDHNLAYAHTSC